MRRGPRLRRLTLLALVLFLTLSCRKPAPVPAIPPNPPDVPQDEIEPQPPDDAEDLGPPDDPDEPEPDQENPEPLTLDQIDLENRSVDELFELVPRLDALEDQRVVLETVVRRQPDHRPALVRLMEVLQTMGVDLAIQEGRREESFSFLNRSAAVARMLLEHDTPPNEKEKNYIGITLYNEACNLSLVGSEDQAIDSLRQALELGFSDPIIWDDPELDALRDREDFAQLLEQYRDQLTPSDTDGSDESSP